MYSGSWDGTIRAWDPRVGDSEKQVGSVECGERVYGMDVVGNHMVVITPLKDFQVYDITQV